MPDAHRIRRLAWRARARSRAEAFVLRRELRETLDGSLLDALSGAFDSAFPASAVVRIPRLELGVRVSSMDPAALEQVLRAEVRRALEGHQAVREALLPHEPRTQNALSDELEVLEEYLRTGALPWFAAGDDRVKTNARLQAIARTQWPDVAARLRISTPLTWPLLFRLLDLLPEPEWPAVAQALGRPGVPAVSWPRLVSALIQSRPPDTRYARARLVAAVMSASTTEITIRTPEDLRAVLEVSAGLPLEQLLAVSATEADRWLEVTCPAAAGETSARADPPPVPTRPAAAATDSIEPPAEASTSSASMHVDHAGLILLAPFLPRFLESARILTGGGRTVPVDARPRAAALLAHLATGSTEVREVEIGFIKILLGLEPRSPLPVADGLLERGDAEECRALLEAVITYWPAVGRTSADGLRASFLARPGRLDDESRAWRLRIEPRGYDVLLDRLPWTISTTVLPWLTKPILTEWPAR